MIKAAGQTGDGRPLVLLGLTGENMTRLMADEPISIDLAALGLPPMQVLIIGGRDDASITTQLATVGLTHPERTDP